MRNWASVHVTQEIFKNFGEDHEVRGVFLDIWKAFDKVWHDGIIFKLPQNGISGNLLKLVHVFSSERIKRVALNGQVSTWTNVTAGALQRPSFGALLFVIYINLYKWSLWRTFTNTKLLADDTSLFFVIFDNQTSTNDLRFRNDTHVGFSMKYQF